MLLSQHGIPHHLEHEAEGKPPRLSRKKHTLTFIIVFLIFAHKARNLTEEACYQDPYWQYPKLQELDQEKRFWLAP